MSSLGYLLKRAQHAFRTSIDESLRPLGLTAPQYAVLCAVRDEEGISNADLARAAFVTPQSMQGILANLERDGLLRRINPERGRIRRTELTEKGQELLRQASRHVDAIQSLLAKAAGDRATEFADLLSRCAEILTSPSEPRSPR